MAGDMPPAVVGVVLAGGLSRRMGGGDKSLRPLGGRPVLAHVIERLRPQVTRLLINANGDPARFSQFDLPVAADLVPDHAGPLAGVLTGLEWAAEEAPECPWVVTVPGDGPFLPRDLVQWLLAVAERASADLATAASGGRSHPVVGLWPVRLRDDLRRAVVEEGVRKVDEWTARHRLVGVTFDTTPIDPFFNVNRPEDLAEAERLLG